MIHDAVMTRRGHPQTITATMIACCFRVAWQILRKMTSSKTPEIGLGSYQTASIARLRSKTPALHSSPHSLQDTRVLDLTIAVADGFSPPPPVDALDVNRHEPRDLQARSLRGPSPRPSRGYRPATLIVIGVDCCNASWLRPQRSRYKRGFGSAPRQFSRRFSSAAWVDE